MCSLYASIPSFIHSFILMHVIHTNYCLYQALDSTASDLTLRDEEFYSIYDIEVRTNHEVGYNLLSLPRLLEYSINCNTCNQNYM